MVDEPGDGPDSADGSGSGGRLRADGGSFSTTRSAPSPSSRELPLLPGVLLGMAAFVGTYAIAYSLRASVLARSALSVQVGANTPETPRLVGWLVYRAHLVPIEYSIEGAPGTVAGVLRSGDVPVALERLARALEPGGLLLVPLAALFVCGFYAALECDVTGPRAGALAGATVVAGYALLVVAAVVATEWQVSYSLFDTTVAVEIGPKELWAILLAGVVYPLIGGAAGGAAAGAIGDDWSPVTD